MAALAAGLSLLSCRQVTGLDGFDVQCVPGEPDCPDPGAPEDCVAQRDSNGDGVLPEACSGAVAWLRETAGNVTKTCPGGFTDYQIEPTRRLLAMQSFGHWGGAVGTLRGELGTCAQDRCSVDAHALDGAGEDLPFQPSLPCNDDGPWHALARGREHAYVAAAVEPGNQGEQGAGRQIAVSAHRLDDASFAWRWEWAPPAAVTSLALAADASAVVAIGQGDRVLLVEPDDAFPGASFRVLESSRLSSMAVGRAAATPVLLLAGLVLNAGKDPAPCGLAPTSATAYVARAALSHGSADAGSPAPVECDGFPLELAIGKDTKSPSLKVVANARGRACWAFLATGSGDKRRLQTGCFDLEDPTFGWQQEAVLGDDNSEDVDIAIDPFGHLLLTALLSRNTPLPLWGGISVALAAANGDNMVAIKLDGDTGEVVWAQMFASPGGHARNPHVAADDDGTVRLGLISDGQPLTGAGLGKLAGVTGQTVHFVGLRP